MIQNIVIVNDHAALNGGQAKVAISSAVGLAESGLNVVFFAGQGPVDTALTEAGVRVVCLDQHDILSDPSRLRATTQGIWNFEAARRLRKLLDEFNPDDSIIHCHGFAKVLSGSIGAVITGHAIPHVFTMHEYFLACPNGGFFHYPDNKICKRRALGFACLTTNCDPRRASHKAWRVARQATINSLGNMPRGLKNVIYISETQLSVMERYLHSGTKRFSVPNPVDAEFVPPVDVGASDIFLFIGRLSPEKGAMLFAEAAAKSGVKAVFVGDGEERQSIMSMLPEATITGWQTPAEVRGWIERARCIVFPSLWYECQPLVPYEALARGVPVIAGGWSAAGEAVTHGRNGLVIQSPEVPELAEAMQKMTRGLAESLGSKAYHEYWAAPLTRARHITGLQHVYRELMEE